MRYRVSDNPLNSAWQPGRILDMSAGGILIEIPEAVHPGSTLELAIDWPGIYHDRPMVRLYVIGAVQRIDVHGTALRILSHEFRNFRLSQIPPRRRANPAVA